MSNWYTQSKRSNRRSSRSKRSLGHPADAPEPKFELGDKVEIMDRGRVLDEGEISFIKGYDDFLEDWKYKVKTPTGRKTWNENSLRKASQTIVGGLRRLANQNPRLRGNIRAILSSINNDGRRIARKTYDEWIKEVDRHIQKKTMMSYRDLPDQPYRRWFDSGMSAKEAADMAIERSGGGMFGL